MKGKKQILLETLKHALFSPVRLDGKKLLCEASADHGVFRIGYKDTMTDIAFRDGQAAIIKWETKDDEKNLRDTEIIKGEADVRDWRGHKRARINTSRKEVDIKKNKNLTARVGFRKDGAVWSKRINALAT